MGTWHVALCMFVISRSVLKMGNVSDMSCREIKTHILRSINPPPSSLKVVPFFEKMGKNIAEPG